MYFVLKNLYHLTLTDVVPLVFFLFGFQSGLEIESCGLKMFRGKIRMQTCRIILFTSLVWFLLDVAILFYYSDSDSSNSPSLPINSGGPIPVADAKLSKREADLHFAPSAKHFDSIKENVIQNEDQVMIAHKGLGSCRRRIATDVMSVNVLNFH